MKHKPLSQIPKEELRWMEAHSCEHRKRFTEHRACYRGPKPERIGFLDIEVDDLAANHGIIYTYCIKDGSSDKIFSDVLTKADINKWGKVGKEDTRLVANLVRDMGHFDLLVTHYGSRFDIPYIRTRAIVCGVDFPSFGVYYQSDTWQILKYKFKLSRNSLEEACRTLLGKTEKTHLQGRYRRGAIRGEAWALGYLLDHNKKDVQDTEKLYHAISKFVKTTKKSI